MQKKRSGIIVDVVEECRLFKVDRTKLKAVLAKVIRQGGVRAAQVAICVTDDKGIAGTNKRFLGHKGPTDVISFDLSEEKGPRVFDITVNAERAAREACARGHSGEAELALYAVHGILHCIGYDDMKVTDARKMHAREDEILAANGYGRTYAGGE